MQSLFRRPGGKWIAGGFALVVVLAAHRAAAAAPTMDLKEGDWETSGETKMEGLPIAIPPIPFKVTQCVLKEDLVPKTDKKGCRTTDVRVSGSTVTWKADCTENGKTSEQTGTITYEPASGATRYEGTIESSAAAGGSAVKTVTKLSGHRVGACSEKSRAEREKQNKGAAK